MRYLKLCGAIFIASCVILIYILGPSTAPNIPQPIEAITESPTTYVSTLPEVSKEIFTIPPRRPASYIPKRSDLESFFGNPPSIISTYTEKHRVWMKEIETKSTTPVLQYHPHPNLGISNKIRGLMSATLFAMLTDRALIATQWRTINDYFKLPIDITHELKNYKPTVKHADYENCFDLSEVKSLIEESAPRIVFSTFCDIISDLLSSKDYTRQLLEAGLITESADSISEKSLQIRYFLYKYFFTPSRSVQKIISTEKMKWKSNSYIIGIHIRQNHIGWEDNTVKFLSQNGIDKMIEEAVKLTNQIQINSKNMTNIKWFITSDNSTAIQLLQKNPLYSSFITTINGYEKLHSRDSGKYTRSSYLATVADLLLLSQCNSLLLTKDSTFSEIGYFRNRIVLNKYLKSNMKEMNEVKFFTDDDIVDNIL